MTMDVSSLGIEVKSTGIKEASQALSGLGTSAANAETKVNKLTDAVERLLKQNVTATMQAWAASMGMVNGAMNVTNNTTNILNQTFNNQSNILINVTNEVSRYAAATNRAATESEGWTARTGVMLNTLKAMTAAFLYYKSINLAKSIVEEADEYTNLNAKMVVANGSQHNANIAMKDAYDISQTLRTSYASTAELMSRMELIMNRTGHTYGEVKTTVTGLAAALHLYGATTGESSSAMLAYAHAASTGLVHMRTLNSLMTSAPLLLQAFQDATGKSGEELRKMSTKGQLTFEMLNKALQDATPKFVEQFERIPLTFSGAMQRLKNAWLYNIGQMAQDTHFNSQLGEGLKLIEGMIPGIAKALGEAFVAVMQWVKENEDGIKEVLHQTGLLILDVWEIGKGITVWTAEVTDAKDSMSLFAGVLLGIRVTLAAIKDALMAIAGVLVAFGAIVVEAVLTPFQLVAGAIGYIADGMAALDNAAAKIQLARGNKAGYEELSKQAQIYTNVSDTMHNFNSSTLEATTRVLKLGEAWAMAGTQGAATMAVLNPQVKQIAKMTPDALRQSEHQQENDSAYQEAADLAQKRAAALKAAAEAAGAKAAEAERKEINKQTEAMAALNTEYEKLLATQQALGEGSSGVKVGPAQSEYLRITNEIVAVEQKKGLLNEAQIERDLRTQLAQASINAEQERYNELMQKGVEADKKSIAKEETLLGTLKQQVDALHARNAAFRNPDGKEGVTNLKADDITAKRDAAQAELDNASFIEAATTQQIEKQQELVKVYQAQLEMLQKLGIEEHTQAQNKLTTEWDKLFDDKKAIKFTNSMVSGMGAIGKAIGATSNAFRSMAENQDKVTAAYKIAGETSDDSALQQQRMAQAEQLESQARIDNYANMTQAAQSFFKKGTDGYKVMGDVEKAFRITEAAMAIKNFALKSELNAAEMEATILGYVKAGLASVESAAVQVASAMGLGPVLAALGVATQAQGDPYSAWGRMAAMAAAMAALGFAVSGSHSSGPSAAQRQATQGTGTVLGDKDKQSQSIADALNALKQNSNINLKYSSAMVASLQNIESALMSTTNAITMNGSGITGTGYRNSTTGKMSDDFKTAFTGGAAAFLTGSLSTALTEVLGVKTSKTLTDSGILSAAQTIGSILAGGFKASQYQDVTTNHSIFGIGLGSSNKQNVQPVDAAIASNFTQIIQGMVTTVTAAAAGLGANASMVAKQLDGVTISLGNISLKGLTAEQITTQLNAVFSSFGDKLVTAALGPLLTGFQQAGEGLLQTAVRVAGGVDEANGELAKLGMTAINFQNVINKSGDVAAEIVRQTILMKEAGTGLGDIISTMSDTAANIGDTYIQLLAVRNGLVDLGIAKDVSSDLLAAAGGLSALQNSLDAYKKNFFTAEQQQAMGVSDLTKQFAALGLMMPSTKVAFVALVNQLSASGDSGQALATKVIGLADAFNNLTSVADTAVANATNDLTTAYNDQVNVINTAKTAFDGFATSLAKFKTSLITGDLSTLSGLQKYQAEKALFEETQAKAAAGDQKALADFQQVSQDFLAASHNVNASGSQYTADYQEVLQKTDALQQFSAGQVSVQDQQLAALNQQVSGLITINSSVLTVAQAIAALQAAMTTGISGGSSNGSGFSFGGVPVPTTYTGGMETTMPVTPTVNGSHALGLARVPYDGYIAQLHKDERVLTAQQSRAYQQSSGSSNAELVAELKSLKDTVAHLREGQREQTAALIAATYDSNAQNADAINEGAKEAVKDASYHQRAKGTLV